MKNHNIKAVLFDLDGVVVRTDHYHYWAWKQLAEEQGWDFDEKINDRLRGVPRLTSLEEILKHNNIELSMESKQELLQNKNKYYLRRIQNISEEDIYPGVIEFIQKMRIYGTKIALCSSSKNANFILEKLSIADLFDVIITGHDVKNAKPHPEIFLLAAKKLRVPEFHCVVFEDAVVGIEAAKSAGMRTVGVGNYKEMKDITEQFITEYSEINVKTFLECGLKQPFPIDKNKIIETNFNRNEIYHMESLFALGNGYMGLRGTYDETDEDIYSCDGMYINGVYATRPIGGALYSVGFPKHDEFTVNLSDWRIFNLYIDGEKACFSKDNIKEHRRELDMKNGKIDRYFIFETSTGKKAAVYSCRIVNMDSVKTAQIRYQVIPINFNGEMCVRSQVIKATKIYGSIQTAVVSEKNIEDIYSFTQEVITTKQQVLTAVTHVVNATDYHVQINNEENLYTYEVVANVMKGETLLVDKFVAFNCFLDDVEDMEADARELIQINKTTGFEKLKERQSNFWRQHWENGDIIIEGNDADQQVVRYSLFQLRQQLATKNQCSIGATGLTGPGYSGKVFWDTEMYLMPYYNFTKPESQKELLMYRYRILDIARARAKEFGTVGAMYAWCSVSGEETSVIHEASTAEYHLQSDIAYAIWRYCDTTDDKEFLYNYGAEIVFETAKFMAHRGSFNPARNGKFCINVVCGPDEYSCGVSNNMYTNFMAKFHLEYALNIVREMKRNIPEKYEALTKKINLSEEELQLWKKASENMYYKYNQELGIHEQDDSFVYKDPVDMDFVPKNVDIRWKYHPLDLWRMQVSKQADIVLLNFLQGDKFTSDEKLRNYNYYEPRCNHGSSLSTAIHSIVAAELHKAEAYEYFRCSAYMDIGDFKKNTSYGLHMACLGGVWMSVIHGFLGMRHYTDGLHFNPQIPTSWKTYQCRIKYKDACVEINVDKQKTEFKLVSVKEIYFWVNDKYITLTKKAPVFTWKTNIL